MKTILVTGSNGLLGQKIIYALRNKAGVRCIATAIGPNRMTVKDGYVYEPLDITDKEHIQKIVSEYKPDVIINTAALTNVDACETKKSEAIQLNVEAVQSFIDIIREEEKKNPQKKIHFIHISTDFVFDGENGPYVETDEPNPLSFYAQSKYDGELLVQKSGIDWTIIRTIIIYGVVDDNSRSNVVLWAKNALEKKQTITVINDQYRSPTLAEDLADACVSAAMKGVKGIYHVSGRETMCILDMVKIVADFFHLDPSFIKPVSSEELKQPAKRPPVTGFIITKAIRDLGFHPHTFMEGLSVVKDKLEKMK
ncbi:MAG: SDR family oxidoreductase [Bacteroidetes bacterium]|nr:SDR family oxidoreductase [Bacteroidota bacterium]